MGISQDRIECEESIKTKAIHWVSLDRANSSLSFQQFSFQFIWKSYNLSMANIWVREEECRERKRWREEVYRNVSFKN